MQRPSVALEIFSPDGNLLKKLSGTARHLSEEKLSDLSFLFPFIGQLRYHLQLGFRLAELLETNATPGDIKHHFPSLRPHTDRKVLDSS
jgi:hypothetical protein